MRRRVENRGEDIQGLVEAFRDGAAALRRRLTQLRNEAAAIEQVLTSVGGSGTPVKRGPGRPRKEISMAMSIAPAPRLVRGAGQGRRAGQYYANSSAVS